MLLKFKIHSIVDVITNSSTVIFTYQDSVTQAKELVAEVMKLASIEGSPDDIFYYGVFCDTDTYTESIDETDEETNLPDDFPSDYKEQDKWMKEFIIKIMKGEVEQPEWMSNAESSDDYDSWNPDSYLHLIPKDEKYVDLAEKIKRLLSSVDADGGHDG